MNKKHAKEAAAGWLDVDQIKERLPIRRVLEHYKLLDQLDVQGNTAVGLSPFHDSSMRSFRVELDRSLWNDFSGRPDGCAGHSVGLVQALEKCSFRRALELAAELAGISAETRGSTAEVLAGGGSEKEMEPDGPRSSPRRDGSAPPHPSHKSTREAHPAQDDQVECHDAGSADTGNDSGTPPFGKLLRGLRHDAPLLADLGISEKTAKAYGVGMGVRGLMKGLLACPVYLPGTDTVAGYVGRSRQPKEGVSLWRNPTGFQRSSYLFGLHRMSATKEGQRAAEKHGLVVVQSPLSVLKLAEAGLRNAVALMDAEVSKTQAELLADPALNPAGKLTLMLNANERGEQGKRRAARRLIHQVHIRYAAWHLLNAAAVSPKDLDEGQLRVLLGLRPSDD